MALTVFLHLHFGNRFSLNLEFAGSTRKLQEFPFLPPQCWPHKHKPPCHVFVCLFVFNGGSRGGTQALVLSEPALNHFPALFFFSSFSFSSFSFSSFLSFLFPFSSFFLRGKVLVGEMAQQLRICPTLVESWSSLPSTHFWKLTTPGNSSLKASSTPFQPLWSLHSQELTNLHTLTHPYTHNKRLIFLKKGIKRVPLIAPKAFSPICIFLFGQVAMILFGRDF